MLLVGFAALLLGTDVVRDTYGYFRDRRALELLNSPESSTKLRGARLITALTPRAARCVDASLAAVEKESGGSTTPELRETYVDALARTRRREHAQVLTAVVRQDPDGRVRRAAWLATARLDPNAFRALATESPVGPDRWDRIGRAAAWLEVGDVRGVPDLFEAARHGTQEESWAACSALHNRVAPLLEAVGRWPVDVDVQVGEVWKPELVDEIARRCAGLDLQAIVNDSRQHLEHALPVRRNMARLTSAREDIAAFIFRH